MKVNSFLMCIGLLGAFGSSYATDGWDIVQEGNCAWEIHHIAGASNTIVLPANVTEYYANVFHPEFTDNVKVIDMSNLTQPIKVHSADPEDYAYGVHVIANSEEIARSWCGISECNTPVADVVPLRGHANRWIIIPTSEQIDVARYERGLNN